MSLHLLIAISGHGFGHIGQTAPVLEALRHRVPDLRISVRSAAPTFKIRERFGTDIQCHEADLDIGMIQRNAIEVALEETADAYRRLHERWSERVEVEANAISDLKPDLVLANVPYLSLAAAERAGIPAVAMCSLNWADIYRFYFEGRAEASRVLAEMTSANNCAECYLQPEPRMPMEDLSNARAIGPIAQLGTPCRTEVQDRTGAGDEDRLVMVSLGGMDVRLPVDKWLDLEGLHLIVPGTWGVRLPHVSAFEDLDLPFPDVMATCDALIAKPGYGSFVEAACLGIPVLYLDRPNWPEVPYLVRWLEQNGVCRQLKPEQIEAGGFRSTLESLWSTAKPAVEPTGVQQAADILASLMT